jgi:hypothetical protein
MKRLGGFAGACLTVIAVAAAILWLLYVAPNERRAVVIGALVAFAVQVAAFAVALTLARSNVMAGWGLGIVVRFVALAAYALLAVPRLGLPMMAALVSLALFFFLSTLIEPFFLKT